MHHITRCSLTAALIVAVAPGWAAALDVQPVAEGVWALVGEAEQRSPQNLGNNATFGVVETADGVVLIDPGGSWAGAAVIHETIRGLTDKPVVLVIDSGGQDHRWLGNGYWAAQGARIVASDAAVEDQTARAPMQLEMLGHLIGGALAGTEPVWAGETFAEALTLEIGGLRFEIVHPGPAHTPGDSFVWVPARGTVFTGDIVYVGRLLGVGEQSSITDWPAAFEALAALNPAHVVPGHGPATDLATARADTYDYLVALRAAIRAHLDSGGDLAGAAAVDQSAFARLGQFDSLARKNAEVAFRQMEWE